MPEIDRRLAGGEMINGRFVAHALSGHERNHLFVNSDGKTFFDLSTISGLDTPADSRGFVLLDYNRDGWQDIALVNANNPLLNLYRNEIGRSRSETESTAANFVAFRFVGGNRQATASERHACRDGYGARVELLLDGVTLKREHRCGEGYATQNSNVMIVGTGNVAKIPQINVRWPSGKNQSTTRVPSRSMLTVYENPDESLSANGIEIDDYPLSAEKRKPRARAQKAERESEQFVLEPSATLANEIDYRPKLRLYTTMATWCESCLRHLPHQRRLRQVLDEASLEMVGLPVDPTDTDEKLRHYLKKWNPPYRLAPPLSNRVRIQLERLLGETTQPDALPSTIVTDQDGTVLLRASGIPSLSTIRKLLKP